MKREEKEPPYPLDCPAPRTCPIDWDDGDELDEEYSESQRLQNFWCIRCRSWKLCAVKRA